MRRLTTIAAAGALGIAGVTGLAVTTGALAPANAATEQAGGQAGDPSWRADRVERIKDALAGLVGDGTISQEQADAVAATLAEEAPVGMQGPGHHGQMLALDAAADALGMTADELRGALRDGQTLAEVAEARGVEVQTLVDALVAEATDRLEAAVADGRISQERADEILADLPDRIAERVQQGMPMGGDGFGRGPDGGMMGGATMDGGTDA
ncbi:MAG: hypothetical protein ACOYXW_17510 [Actinomycetota bacterium]